MKDRIFIIDGSSYLYRAYHAMPPLSTSRGQPTGAIKGVTNMLMTLKKDSEGSPIIVVFDAKGKKFRNEIYKEYKSNRTPMPDDLREQLKPLKDICKAIGFPLIEIEGVEADDVIATIVRTAKDKKFKAVVSSLDKDLMQLVEDPSTTIMNTMTHQIFNEDKVLKDVKKIVNEVFSNHPGDSNNYWLGSSRKDAIKALNLFIKEKIVSFGDYEDAVKKNSPFLLHSVLSPYLNLGLITPKEIINTILEANEDKKIPLNSLEGFVRQIIGWREFMRGIYQNYDDKLENTNFFNHQRKLTDDWYNGTTGIDPIDDAIKDVNTYGYAHHIIRLMHLSNIMTLSQLHPKEIYKWFMEMFVDSSDWVMSPNVFGMGTYSDGGIFSTKPYICGSNYIIKMSNYKKGNWSDIVDGLYWSFVHNNKEILSKNPRMGMVMMSYRKLKEERKDYLLKIANEFIAKKTT